MKLFIEQGLPASGKTTHARGLVDNGNVARVNYDDLRLSLFNGKWSPTKERAVQDAAKAMVRSLLGQGLNVVIDNTNLTEKHIQRWKTIAHEFVGCSVEVIRHNVSLLECVDRDSFRHPDDHVGRAVIERMSLQAGWTTFDPEDKIVIVDVDGTLINSGPCAEKWLKPANAENNWDEFFRCGHESNAIYAVQTWVKALTPDYKVIICSGRSDYYSGQTTAQLKRNGIPFDHILMRRESDHRPDTMVKQEILNLLPKQQIAFIIDDRQSVCDMWRKVKQDEQLPYSVYQVAEGNF